MIFHNGCVHTVDPHDTIVEALAISNNRIIATGTNEAILAMAADDTQRIDLGGRSLIPGILDTHAHAVEVGLFLKNLFCNGIPSIRDLVDAVAEKVAALPKGAWLQGGCWIETQFSENRMPTRWDLDPVSPDHPVVIERIFSTCVANSCALHMAGITRNTPDPAGGTIERDPKTGEPTGILHRSAKALVRNIMPTGTDTGSLAGSSVAEIRALAQTAMQAFVAYGITGTLEAGVGPDMCRAYHDMNKSGDLLVRTSLMPNWYGFTITQNMEQMDRLIGGSATVAIVVGPGDREPNGGRNVAAGGIVLALLGAFGQGAGVVLAKEGLDSIAAMPATLLRLAAGTAGLLLAAAAGSGLSRMRAALTDSGPMKKMIPATVLGTYLALLLMMFGVASTPATIAAVLLATSPIFSLVIEAIAEDMAIKAALFAELTPLLADDCVITSIPTNLPPAPPPPTSVTVLVIGSSVSSASRT